MLNECDMSRLNVFAKYYAFYVASNHCMYIFIHQSW